MKKVTSKVLLVMTAVVAVAVLSGCTDWKKKYEGLNVENQNLQGLYDNCKGALMSSADEKVRLGQELSTSQQTIDELQKQVDELNKKSGKDGMWELDAQAGTITATLPDTILFDSGRAELKKTRIAELDQIYGAIREKYSGRKIDVVGHTDTDPIQKSKWKDNWELSAQRALTVVRYLTNKGIGVGDIRAVGCGQARPVASNSSASGKSQNRRVEIVVHLR